MNFFDLVKCQCQISSNLIVSLLKRTDLHLNHSMNVHLN